LVCTLVGFTYLRCLHGEHHHAISNLTANILTALYRHGLVVIEDLSGSPFTLQLSSVEDDLVHLSAWVTEYRT
jgi:hypothetical protein